jgi:regulator of sirC expression with transglutaminase-like and TPR domain
MPVLPTFAELVATPEPPLDQLTLALASEFRDVDTDAAMTRLDALGAEVAGVATRTRAEPACQAQACVAVLAGAHGFIGATRNYDDPDNSMLDLVLVRRRGLPILLSIVYVEVSRRAGIPLVGVGLPGHFVVGHLGMDPPLLLDPFTGGHVLDADMAVDTPRAWGSHEVAMRMLNNLVACYQRRGDLGAALRAASMRALLPAGGALQEVLQVELRALQARLN